LDSAKVRIIMHNQSKIYVAGHTGLVGSALMRKLIRNNYTEIITRTFEQLDLRNQAQVLEFFKQEKPEYIFIAAARVGGIHANNKFPAQFMYDNLLISSNIIHASHLFGVKKLLYLGSSCIYPRDCPQPIKEEYLLSGVLEKTNEPYALAKIAGLKLCESYNREYNTQFISCMPTNLYGPGDNFDIDNGHVIPALIAKFIYAKNTGAQQVTCWGTGKARREFMYVDDLADALLFLMQNYNNYSEQSWINIGTGIDISILELAELIGDLIGYDGHIFFDTQKPDGTPKKLLDITKLTQLGWCAKTPLNIGLKHAIEWYLSRIQNIEIREHKNRASENIV
jgi:GDP-L-fucose synthase